MATLDKIWPRKETPPLVRTQTIGQHPGEEEAQLDLNHHHDDGYHEDTIRLSFEGRQRWEWGAPVVI